LGQSVLVPHPLVIPEKANYSMSDGYAMPAGSMLGERLRVAVSVAVWSDAGASTGEKPGPVMPI
jgi:hypothetical protein